MFVSLGLGSVIASAVETAPWLIAVGRYKSQVFVAVGILLALNYWLAIVRPRRLNCAPGDVCHIDTPAMRVSRVILGECRHLGWRRHDHVHVAVVGEVATMNTRIGTALLAVVLTLALSPPAFGSGHGPVFGVATPTLGRGGWSLDQAWTMRAGNDDEHEQMLKTMLSFGITENLQLSGSFPLATSDGTLAPARMMGAMSSDREFEALTAYRFQRRTIGIGGRQESTFYVGGTAPFERRRNGIDIGPSVEAGISTGYASRAHYAWVGAAVQHYFDRGNAQFGDSRLITGVYGYRPAILRTEAGKPDLRFLVEVTAEDRARPQVSGVALSIGARVAYFFWLK